MTEIKRWEDNSVNLTGYLCMSLYSLALLAFVYIQTLRQVEKRQLQYRLYRLMLEATFLLLIVDMISRLDGKTGILYVLVSAANFWLFLLSVFSVSLWLLYAHYQVFHNKTKLKNWVIYIALVNGIDFLLLVLSQFYGLVYYFDSDHIYHRGPLFVLPALMMIGMVLLSTVLVVSNYKKIEPNYVLSLLFFPIPPLIGGIIQIVFYSMPIGLSCEVLSMLIIFVNVQNKNKDIDYLTEAYNRRKLDMYLKDKIDFSTKGHTFSAILIDIDRFKYINDRWGHVVGDHALKSSVEILKRSLSPNTFIARYGGDEFCVVLDIFDIHRLQKCIDRINRNLDEFNHHHYMPFQLKFSMGYEVYDYQGHIDYENFLRKIDRLMYLDKQKRKTEADSRLRNTNISLTIH